MFSCREEDCVVKKNNFFKLEMLLLIVIKKEDMYGYEITNMLREVTNDVIDIKEGSLYPILYKLLEKKKLVAMKK